MVYKCTGSKPSMNNMFQMELGSCKSKKEVPLINVSTRSLHKFIKKTHEIKALMNLDIDKKRN